MPKYNTIPKIIHYCWFGGNQLPDLAVKCIASWKKFFPDYEIKEWNESNFDFNCCEYVKEAYQAQKWAFVSDYARFWILYKYGGLYFDTDVEVIKSMHDLIEKGSFMGCEPYNSVFSIHKKNSLENRIKVSEGVNAGLGLAATPGLGLYKEILVDYENDHFRIPEKGSPMTVVERVTKVLLSFGFQPQISLQNPEGVQLIEGVYIYPSEYFCPLDYNTGKMKITQNTRSIHHYTASWLNNTDKKIVEIQQRFAAKGKSGCRSERLITLPLRVKNKVTKLGISGMFKFAIKKILKKV